MALLGPRDWTQISFYRYCDAVFWRFGFAQNVHEVCNLVAFYEAASTPRGFTKYLRLIALGAFKRVWTHHGDAPEGAISSSRIWFFGDVVLDQRAFESPAIYFCVQVWMRWMRKKGASLWYAVLLLIKERVVDFNRFSKRSGLAAALLMIAHRFAFRISPELLEHALQHVEPITAARWRNESFVCEYNARVMSALEAPYGDPRFVVAEFKHLWGGMLTVLVGAYNDGYFGLMCGAQCQRGRFFLIASRLPDDLNRVLCGLVYEQMSPSTATLRRALVVLQI
jgi:hypothetical protein